MTFYVKEKEGTLLITMIIFCDRFIQIILLYNTSIVYTVCLRLTKYTRLTLFTKLNYWEFFLGGHIHILMTYYDKGGGGLKEAISV